MAFKQKPKIGRCLICRKLGHPLLPISCTDLSLTTNRPGHDDFKMHEVLNSFAKSCIDSVCRLLRIPKSHPFKHFLLNASYCRDCMQLIRDVDFALKQLSNFQMQILNFRQDLFTKFGKSYEAIPQMQADAVAGNQKNKDPKSTQRMFSFDEVVKMVYNKIEKESDNWTDTDFMKEEDEGSNRLRIRNILEIVDLEENGNEPEKQPGSRPRRKRVKVSYNESDGKFEEDIVNNVNRKTDTKDNPTIHEGNGTDESDDMNFNDDTDPDWGATSDADSILSRDGDDQAAAGEPDGSKPPIKRKRVRIRNRNKERKPFICSCGLNFDLETSLLTHKRKVHEDDPTPYHCDLCDVKCRSRDTFNTHRKGHLPSDPVPCLECGKTYPSDVNLKKHMKRIHSSKWKCKFCNMVFENEEKLEEHVNSHKSSEQPFSCTICDAPFTNSTTLKQHMSSHTDSRCMCEVCGKPFLNSKSLKKHGQIHDESFIGHQCEVCGHKFQSAGVLALHMTKHSEEKKFICEVCGAGFKYSKGLKVHKRNHDGEFPFVCQICGKGFIASHLLKHHEEIHSGTLSYECDICQKKFRGISHLRQHERTHQPKDPNRKRRVRRPRLHLTNVDSSEVGAGQGNSEVHSPRKVKFRQNLKSKEKKEQYPSSSECESESEMEAQNYENIESDNWAANKIENREQEHIAIQSAISSITRDQDHNHSGTSERLQQSYYSMPTLISAVGVGRARSVPGPSGHLIFTPDVGVPHHHSFLGNAPGFEYR